MQYYFWREVLYFGVVSIDEWEITTKTEIANGNPCFFSLFIAVLDYALSAASKIFQSQNCLVKIAYD